MQGVSLDDGLFEEPPPKESGHQLPRLATGSAVEERRKHLVHKRRERFGQVMHALKVLISWAKLNAASRRRCSSSALPRKPGGSIASSLQNESGAGRKLCACAGCDSRSREHR